MIRKRGRFVAAALLAVWALLPSVAVAEEESLVWSDRHQSEYTAPEMYLPANALDVYQVIYDAFEAHGWPISYLTAVQIAVCESGLNPLAAPRGNGGPVGLYQFIPTTWEWTSVAAGYGGRSRYDPVASAGVAAWLMAHPRYGGWRHWASCVSWV